MRAGQLDRTITLERFTETVKPSGSIVKAWVVFATVRAEVVQQSATEFLTGYGEAENGTIIFRIRFYPGITTADSIMYNDVRHDLKEIKEIGRRRGLELRAVATT